MSRKKIMVIIKIYNLLADQTIARSPGSSLNHIVNWNLSVEPADVNPKAKVPLSETHAWFWALANNLEPNPISVALQPTSSTIIITIKTQQQEEEKEEEDEEVVAMRES